MLLLYCRKEGGAISGLCGHKVTLTLRLMSISNHHTGDRWSRTSTFPGILFLYLEGLMEIDSKENPELSLALISEILKSDEEEATEDYVFG